jgi:WD40 repeat protein
MCNSKVEFRRAFVRWIKRRWWVVVVVAVGIGAAYSLWHEWLRFDSMPTPARSWTTERTTHIAFSPDSRWLAFTDRTSVVIHNLQDGRESRVYPRLPYWGQYAGLGFTPDSQMLIVAGQDDGLIEYFDVEDTSLRRTIAFGEDSLYLMIALVRSDRLLCIRGLTHDENAAIACQLINPLNAAERQDVQLDRDRLRYANMALSPNEDLLARGIVHFRSHRIVVNDLPSGKRRGEQSRPGGIPWSLTIDGESKRLANADRGLVRVWTLPDLANEQIWEMPGEVNAVAFNLSNGALAAGSGEGTWLGGGVIRIWNADGRRLRTWRTDEPIHCLAISPDGNWLAAGSRDGRVQFWKWESMASGQ